MRTDPQQGLLDLAQLGDVTVARFTRRTILEAEAIRALGARLRGLVRDQGCRKVLLNFARVESLTSAMLGQFVSLHAELTAAAGQLAFCHVDPFLLQIFRICNMPPEIPVYPDEAAGLRALTADPGGVAAS
jgi:anti-anti-sigma factor